jgi:hypothetical protein
VHLLSHVVECVATDLPFNIQTSCSKCNPCAWMNFLTRVTKELVTLRRTEALLMLLAALRITPANSQRCKKQFFVRLQDP